MIRAPLHQRILSLAFTAFGLTMVTGCLGSSSKTSTPSITSSATTVTPTESRPVSDSPPRAGSPGADPLAANSWHLKNTGQSTYSSSTGTANAGYDLNLETTYSSGGNGAGVIVMVADDGVESSHEDLSENLLLGESRDYSKSGSYAANWADPIGVDDNHGTAVAGIIAAQGNNSLGSRGVACEAKLISANPLSEAVSASNQITALKDHLSADFDIANQSFGLDQDDINLGDSTYKTLMGDAATNGRGGRGKVIVKAAGNSFVVDFGTGNSHIYRFGNASFDGYNTTPYTVVVGAINAVGYPASYSTPGSAIWVSAPGGEFGDDAPAILTTDASGCNVGFSLLGVITNLFERGGLLNSGCRYTSAFNGTSAATPMVSGVAALLLEANPNLTARDVKFILAKTAKKIRPSVTGYLDYTGLSTGAGFTWEQGWITNAAGFNFNNFYGFGLVDTDAAVAYAKTYADDLGVFQESNWASVSGLNLSIPDYSATGASSSISVANTLVAEAVQVQVTLDHENIGDVQLELTSPSGTKSILLNANNATYNSTSYGSAIFLSNAFYGESTAGTWTLKALDGKSSKTGTLKGWKIKVFGH